MSPVTQNLFANMPDEDLFIFELREVNVISHEQIEQLKEWGRTTEYLF